MLRAALFSTVLALSTTLPAAQTASATVRTACSQPGPPGSLVAEPRPPLVFLPDDDDVVVMECESVGPLGNWVEETTGAGFGGDAYLRWDGPNLFTTPGQDVLSFQFRIETAGDYIVRVHVRHDDPDPDQGNDCWLRLDGGPWEKLFHNTGVGGVGVWTFNARLESTGDFPQYTLTEDLHTLQLSGRSNGFKIDRVHVIPVSTWFANLADPESEPVRKRPIMGRTFTVLIDDPTGAAGVTPGSTLVGWFATTTPTGNHPCGVLYRGGEILIGLSPPPMKGGPLKVWSGAPVAYSVPIPNDPAFLGLPVYTQGVFLDNGLHVPTDALDLIVGTF